MNISVRFFAALADIVKSREITLALPDDAPTVKEAFDHLCARHHDLAKYSRNILYAVNGEFVSPDSRLKEGDELAFLPPVSGGRAGDNRQGASAVAQDAILRYPV
jgi:molybdopterin converting factor subunit 1